MGKARDNKRISGYAILLLTIFLTYLCSNSLFTHYHYLDGEYATHSHIYTGTPDKPDHNHTPTQFQLIATLSHFWALGGVSVEWVCTPIYFLCGVIAIGVTNTITRRTSSNHLRAPPATMISH